MLGEHHLTCSVGCESTYATLTQEMKISKYFTRLLTTKVSFYLQQIWIVYRFHQKDVHWWVHYNMVIHLQGFKMKYSKNLPWFKYENTHFKQKRSLGIVWSILKISAYVLLIYYLFRVWSCNSRFNSFKRVHLVYFSEGVHR